MARRMGLGRGLDAFFNTETDTKDVSDQNKEKKADTEKKPASSGKKTAKNDKKPAEKESASPKKAEKGAAENKEPLMISMALIDADSTQPRKSFDSAELASLAETIKNYGVLQPLLVEKKGERYVIVAGERRYRAAKLAGLTSVPVRVDTYTPQKRMEISLIENIQRSDLNPIEEAKAYQSLVENFGLRQEDVAQRVAKNRATITNSMRLLKLDERVQSMLIEGTLSGGHARALLALADKEQQAEVAGRITEKGLSVRETEKLVKKLLEDAEKPENSEEPDKEPEDRFTIFYRDLEEQLKSIMGTKVQIRRKDQNKGKIEIDYYSPEELERITELLQSLQS